jgi:hypothetical protein
MISLRREKRFGRQVSPLQLPLYIIGDNKIKSLPLLKLIKQSRLAEFKKVCPRSLVHHIVSLCVRLQGKREGLVFKRFSEHIFLAVI